MAEIVTNTARNWRKERFRKYTVPLFRPRHVPSMWGRLATCAAVGYRRRPAANAGVRSGSGRLTTGRSLPSCPTSPLPSARPLFSRDASHADQVSENDAFQGLRGGHSGVAAAAAHRHGLQPGTVFVEGAGVPPAGVVVEIQFHAGPGFGVAQFQFAGPRGNAVFIRPDLQQHQFMPVIGQILQRFFAAPVVQEIGDDDDQSCEKALQYRSEENKSEL